VDEVCLPLEPDAAAGRLDAFRAAGADLPVIYPVVPRAASAGDVVRTTLEALVLAR
jgi:hypothetical protein